MRVPADEGLAEARAATSGEFIRVGDVLAPRAIPEIMFEGEKVGRAI
jgi:hypothetical protein